jgi:transposase InsO family protein
MRLAHHLWRDTSGIWYFRVVVPRRLRDALGRSLIKQSLRTREPIQARAWSYVLSAKCAQIFAKAEQGGWAQQYHVELIHIQPEKPTQNAYIERFNRTFRTEVLDRYVFTTLNEVRRIAEDWRHRYNHDRPHRSLGGPSPIRYAMASSTLTSTSE